MREARTARRGGKDKTAADADILDVAIVGMGPAGLYTAWRLCSAPADQHILGKPAKDLRIGLYDTMPEDRVGGRLCTQPLPGYPFLAELGGMRFRSNQLLVNGLVDALNLSEQVEPFSFDQHFYYLREKRFGVEDFKNEAAVGASYTLNRSEKGLLPHTLIESAIQKTLKSLRFGPAWAGSQERSEWAINGQELRRKLKTMEGLQELSPREWAVIQRFGEYRNSSFLSDVGFWDLLQFQLSSGAWHLANDGLGYESVMGNWNAAIALPWFIHDFANTEFKTLKNGMKSIALRLYEEINKSSNVVAVKHRYDLAGVDFEQDGNLLRLQFDEDGNSQPQTVLARSVVLALPKGALIRLNFGDAIVSRASVPERAPAGFDPRIWFSDLLHSVDGRALFKLFLGYSSPWWTKTKWWRRAGAKSLSVHGKVNTDLPLRQVYYYGKEKWNEARKQQLGLTAQDQHAMIMASYSDSHYIEFWSELKKEGQFRYKSLKGKLSPEDQRVHDDFGAPISMVSRAERLLEMLHGEKIAASTDEPRAEIGLYMEWSRPPYYAGWHSWKVGVKPWEICNNIMRPFGDLKVFLCGEAYSSEQGWVEGALKSAERLLALQLDVPVSPNLLRTRFAGSETNLRQYLGMVE